MITGKLLKNFFFLAMCMCVFACNGRVAAESLHIANIEISYFPQNLEVNSQNGKDVLVDLELIFRETTGVSAHLDQMKMTFSTPGGMSIEVPQTFIDMRLSAGMESHIDTTLIVPANVSMICLGAAVFCDLSINLRYSGQDAQGNSISASVDIPVRISVSPSRETFSVGIMNITSPMTGQMVNPLETVASADIFVTGIGSVSGEWILNGKPVSNFSKSVMGEGKITVEFPLPANLPAKNMIQLMISQPELKMSDEIEFMIAGKKLVGVTTGFHAGFFSVKDVTLSPESRPGAITGYGKAVFSLLGFETDVNFEKLSIVDVNGVEKLDGGQIISDVEMTMDRGPLKVRFDTILITADGAWADGSVTLEPSGISDGIGPLYFYALPFNENGLSGSTKLDTPQKGEKGEYKATVSEFEIIYEKTVASLKVSGDIQKSSEPDWKMPLSISVSFGGVGK